MNGTITQSLALTAESIASTSGLLSALHDGVNRCTCASATCDPCICQPLLADAGGDGAAGGPS